MLRQSQSCEKGTGHSAHMADDDRRSRLDYWTRGTKRWCPTCKRAYSVTSVAADGDPGFCREHGHVTALRFYTEGNVDRYQVERSGTRWRLFVYRGERYGVRRGDRVYLNFHGEKNIAGVVTTAFALGCQVVVRAPTGESRRPRSLKLNIGIDGKASEHTHPPKFAVKPPPQVEAPADDDDETSHESAEAKPTTARQRRIDQWNALEEKFWAAADKGPSDAAEDKSDEDFADIGTIKGLVPKLAKILERVIPTSFDDSFYDYLSSEVYKMRAWLVRHKLKTEANKLKAAFGVLNRKWQKIPWKR